MEAMQIVRRNMLGPEEWIIDAYTISCFFSPRKCKDVGIWFVGEGLFPRREEVE